MDPLDHTSPSVWLGDPEPWPWELLPLLIVALAVWVYVTPAFWWFVRFARFFGRVAAVFAAAADVLNRWAVAANRCAMRWLERTETELKR